MFYILDTTIRKGVPIHVAFATNVSHLWHFENQTGNSAVGCLPGFPELSAEVKRLKETEGGLGPMCKIVQEIVEAEVREATEEVRKETRKEERIEAIKTLIECGIGEAIIVEKYGQELFNEVKTELKID